MIRLKVPGLAFLRIQDGKGLASPFRLVEFPADEVRPWGSMG
jgi:hypothetical protein